MSELAGLDLAGRAALLGLSCREYVKLAEADPRIAATAALETPGSVTRTRRWLDAGRPVADPERVAFTSSSDSVRALVVRALAGLPAPVTWHAVEYVTWIEVGRSNYAWQCTAPQMRAPAGDAAHFIALCGLVPDDDLVGLVGHELAHSWHRTVYAAPPAHVPMSNHERTARHLFDAKDRGLDVDAYARELIYEERLADRTSTAWGLVRCTDELHLARIFRARLDAANALADEIAHQVDATLASDERATATLSTEGAP